MKKVTMVFGKASEKQILEHLLACDSSFTPALSSRVNIYAYAKKLKKFSLCVEAWSRNILVGLLCVYCNNHSTGAYISNVSVLPDFQGMKIADRLLLAGIDEIYRKKFHCITLELSNKNLKALNLYQKFGFLPFEKRSCSTVMVLRLTSAERYNDSAT